MKSVKYETTEEQLLENEKVMTYGILVYYYDDISCENTKIVSINDISTYKEQVEKLVNLCNKLSLSPLHLMDVILDFIS